MVNHDSSKADINGFDHEIESTFAGSASLCSFVCILSSLRARYTDLERWCSMVLRPVGCPHCGWATSLPRLLGDANPRHRPRLCLPVLSISTEIRFREHIISTYSLSLRLSSD